MFGLTQPGAHAYARVGLETGVLAASPHQLVVMLFEGAIAAIKAASHHMARGAIAEKSAAITKAACIIESGLRTSLDKEVGGEIALQLDALYGYASQRLLMANLKNDQAILSEVAGLMQELMAAWLAIDPNALKVSTQEKAPSGVATNAFKPHNASLFAAYTRP